MKTLLATLVMTTAIATAAVADGYQSPRMIEAITTHDYAHLSPSDKAQLKARVGYVAGFTLYFDRSCDFLPSETFQRIAEAVTAMIKKDDQPFFKESVKVGVSDAKEFLAKNGCATATAKSARKTLDSIWTDKPSSQAKPGHSI